MSDVPMAAGDVMAVVVSYNGRDSIGATVGALLPQVGAVHVVDNGSDARSDEVLAALEALDRVTVERLGRNAGIGHALNRGVARARERGVTWLLTMDQDSIVEPDLVTAFGRAIREDGSRTCLTPEIVSASAARSADRDINVSYAITSGNLVRLSLFDQVGAYDEALFIDCVDFDFSLRVRAAGHRITRVHGARMRHQLGDAVAVPPRLRKFYARHSPVRRYYMYRNYCYLAERHLWRFPGFVLRLGVLQAVLFGLVAWFDPSPMASYRSIARGSLDYLRRRSGPDPKALR